MTWGILPAQGFAMTYSLVNASVGSTASLATFNIKTSAVKNETSANAINIGNLTEQSDTVSVSNAGALANTAVSTTFSGQTGDLATLSQNFNNVVDQASTRYQLYAPDGTTIIADNQGTTAQQLAYTEWVGSGLTLSSSGTYTAIATPDDGSAAAISSSQTQGTALGVTSTLTGSDANEYYNFALTAGNNIKLNFDAGSATPSTRVQLYNANGQLVADSEGNAYQQANYVALTSGTGLTASPGNYSVEVSYANGVNPDSQSIPYSFQLYSGSTYSVVYNNSVTAQPTDTTAAGSVTATSQALAYSRSAFNTISETAATAVNAGWLQENKSALQVESQLTSADSADYFSFTLQSGNNLKFGFDSTTTTDPSALRVQIYDSTGSELIADSQGTAAQQAAYKELTTTNGLTAKAGTYVAKISYAPGVTPSTQTYLFNIYSGTSYAALYKTIASAQTYGNALLSGSVSGYSAAQGAAAYLASISNSVL